MRCVKVNGLSFSRVGRRSWWLLSGVVVACAIPGCRARLPPSQVAEERSAEASASTAPVPAAEPSPVALEPEPAPAKRKARRARGPRPGPPKIRHARLIDPRHLELVFTEPLAPVGEVDPDRFRLSVGMDYRYARYAYAYYYDLGEAFSDKAGHFRELRQPEPDRLLFELAAELDLETCEEITEMRREIRLDPGVRGDVGLFIHYRADGPKPVVDTQGEALAEVGPAFAEDRKLMEREFEGRDARQVLARLQAVDCEF